MSEQFGPLPRPPQPDSPDYAAYLRGKVDGYVDGISDGIDRSASVLDTLAASLAAQVIEHPYAPVPAVRVAIDRVMLPARQTHEFRARCDQWPSVPRRVRQLIDNTLANPMTRPDHLYVLAEAVREVAEMVCAERGDSPPDWHQLADWLTDRAPERAKGRS